MHFIQIDDQRVQKRQCFEKNLHFINLKFTVNKHGNDMSCQQKVMTTRLFNSNSRCGIDPQSGAFFDSFKHV